VIVVDTSVAIPAALPGHVHHAIARSSLPRDMSRLIAHVAIETYSVLTRLPPPRRFDPAVALAYLREGFQLPPAALAAVGYETLLELASTKDITGGAMYDAIVGMTANELGATLLTLDRRAIKTYELLGVDYRLVA
jgi:predicted nucleic acid-binding protein